MNGLIVKIEKMFFYKNEKTINKNGNWELNFDI